MVEHLNLAIIAVLGSTVISIWSSENLTPYTRQIFRVTAMTIASKKKSDKLPDKSARSSEQIMPDLL